MNVLYSCLSQSWGGMEMFTINAVKKLIEKDFSVVLLCYPNSKIYQKAVQENIETFPIKASGYFHPFEIIKIAKLISNPPGLANFDVVHTQASKDLWVLSPALKLANSNIPLFLTKQVGSFIVKKDLLHKFIYKRVTTVFAISEVIRRNLLDTVPISQEKIKLLHNAVDTSEFNPQKYDAKIVRNEFGIREDQIVIGMLARFSKGKGHEEFLLAAKNLCKKYPNLKFMIVGEPSRGEENYGKEIKQLSTDYNLNSNVIFTGYRSDIPNVISAMDIFAFPSHSEAFGIALVEAMAMRKPSVCSNSDGVLDITVDGVTGFLFEKGNEMDLSEKLEKLIISDETRYQLGTNARKRAVQMFDIKILTDKVVEFYNDTIK